MITDAFDNGVRGGLVPAIAACPLWARRFLSWPVRVAQVRALLGQLGAMSERELADIGLSRTDLRDATALPRGDDPSPFLCTRRIGKKRRSWNARCSGMAPAAD